MPSRKESRNSLSLQPRSSVPPACVARSSISFGHCCQLMVSEWPSRIRKFGRILPTRKFFQRSRNGGYSLSRGSLCSVGRESSGPHFRGWGGDRRLDLLYNKL